MTIDLPTLRTELLGAASTASSGRATRGLHAAPDKTLTQVLLALCAGRELSEHENPGQATLQVMSGRVRLTAGSQEWSLGAEEFMVIPQTRHSLHAIDDSVVLLTIAHQQQ